MAKAVIKRIGAALVVLIVVTLLSFLVLHVLPGDAAVLELGLDSSPEKLAALRASMGTDKPLPVQYFDWIGGVCTGDWGTSSLYGKDVLEVIADAVPVTLSIAVFATLIATVVAFALGIASALHPDSAIDVITRTIVQLASALPGFLLAILLMLLFSLALHALPSSGYADPFEEGVGAWIASITLPSVVLAVGEIGPLTRIVRSSMLSSLSRDYMLSTQVKGLSRARSVVAYALRGALVAPLMVMGQQLAKLLSGAVIVESVFALPGLGRLMLTAVEQRDVMLLQGIILVVTVAVVLVTLVADLLAMAADPSLRTAQVPSEQGGRP
jgi:peptide/nickel transport system permease protein